MKIGIVVLVAALVAACGREQRTARQMVDEAQLQVSPFIEGAMVQRPAPEEVLVTSAKASPGVSVEVSIQAATHFNTATRTWGPVMDVEKAFAFYRAEAHAWVFISSLDETSIALGGVQVKAVARQPLAYELRFTPVVVDPDSGEKLFGSPVVGRYCLAD